MKGITDYQLVAVYREIDRPSHVLMVGHSPYNSEVDDVYELLVQVGLSVSEVTLMLIEELVDNIEADTITKLTLGPYAAMAYNREETMTFKECRPSRFGVNFTFAFIQAIMSLDVFDKNDILDWLNMHQSNTERIQHE